MVFTDAVDFNSAGKEIIVTVWKLQEDVLSPDDRETLASFIRQTTRFTQFTQVKDFEQAFAAWQGCNYSVFVNSGSSANLLLVNALKQIHHWRDGDEVIVPVLTWPTTVTPVMQCGLTPVFIDTNLTDLSFDYLQLERKITPRTRGIFVAHILGFPAALGRLKDIADRHNLILFEDCCESQGASVDGVKVGNLSAAGTFSFYWGHHMTTVEGGMLCTNNEELYKLCVLKRSHGLARELPPRYHAELKAQHSDLPFEFLFLTDGFNFRNTEFSAVLGSAQLKHVDKFIQIRNRNYRRFSEICGRYPEELIVPQSPGISSFVLPFLFRDIKSKQGFQKFIIEAGIECRPLISGNLLYQPFLKQYYEPTSFPNADFLHHNSFYIGNNQFVDEERLRGLDEVLRRFFGR